MPDASNLPYIIRLLDDDDPAVSKVVDERLSEFGGDISKDLAALGIEVDPSSRKKLAYKLSQGRRQKLANEWQAPSRGISGWDGDWHAFEHALRLIADFLHDGITLRDPLPDALDKLVEGFLNDMDEISSESLRQWLFVQGRFQGAAKNADACRCFDLSDVLLWKRGNSTSLAFLFMLIGNRLNLEIGGCDYPGHFLARMDAEEGDLLVDCYHQGKTFPVKSLLSSHPELSKRARAAVQSSVELGWALRRYLHEIKASLSGVGREDDALFFSQLLRTLEP